MEHFTIYFYFIYYKIRTTGYTNKTQCKKKENIQKYTKSTLSIDMSWLPQLGFGRQRALLAGAKLSSGQRQCCDIRRRIEAQKC